MTIPFYEQKTAKKDTRKDTRSAPKTKIELLLEYCSIPRSLAEMMHYMQLNNRASFTRNYIKPLISSGKLSLTIPEQPPTEINDM